MINNIFNFTMKKYMIIAHRGVTEHGHKDNSFQSLIGIKDIKSEFTLGVEFDIQLTADNKLVLYHDEYLENISIENSYFKDIIKKDESVIELHKILREFDNTEYILNIELKCYSSNRLDIYCNILIDLLKKYNARYILSSFNFNLVKLLKNISFFDIYYISENIDDKNVSITNYECFNRFNNIIAIYTLYDELFNEDKLLDILKAEINILITDNVEKLNNYLIKYLDKD